MDELRYFREHPPSCIAGFAARSVERPQIGFDGHGRELNTFFNLSCRCGCDQHHVLGYYWHNPDYHNVLVFLSPLTLHCVQCNSNSELVDTNRHGYDAELGGIVATARGEGDSSAFNCDVCGPKPFAICVRFEYSEALFDEDYADFRGREQDLFSWFSIVGHCTGCSRLIPITEFECA